MNNISVPLFIAKLKTTRRMKHSDVIASLLRNILETPCDD